MSSYRLHKTVNTLSNSYVSLLETEPSSALVSHSGLNPAIRRDSVSASTVFPGREDKPRMYRKSHKILIFKVDLLHNQFRAALEGPYTAFGMGAFSCSSIDAAGVSIAMNLAGFWDLRAMVGSHETEVGSSENGLGGREKIGKR